MLYSTDVATLFLDTELRIRFFTPATKDLVSVIPGDIGRPLSDLNLLASDSDLLADARDVLRTRKPIEREIMTRGTAWYSRRILPYRTQDNGGRRRRHHLRRHHRAPPHRAEARGSEAPGGVRERRVKSRFLAAASHDLRQPLQTLTLLQGLLAKSAEGGKTHDLVMRLGETLSAMSGMLNTLLDINQIEAGTIHPEIVRFPVNDLLDRLRSEFAYHAEAQSLGFRVVPCGLAIESDPRLLEQILRNLLSNALKYTRRGKVLLGCRRQGGLLRIEVWDTGIGIPDSERQAVFRGILSARQSGRASGGAGSGSALDRAPHGGAPRAPDRGPLLSGQGLGFAIELALPPGKPVAQPPGAPDATPAGPLEPAGRRGAILVVEDDRICATRSGYSWRMRAIGP